MRLTTALPDLTLRPFALSDLDHLVAAANDPEVARWLRDRFPRPYTRDDAQTWIAHKEPEAPATSFAIALDDRFIGAVGVDVQKDVYHRSGELGSLCGLA